MEAKENINFIFQLNNKSRSANYFLLFISSGVFFISAAFYFVAVNLTLELILTVVVAVAYFILFSKIKPSFFELLVTDNQLQLNYYSVASTFRNYQSIEMNLSQLRNFKIKKSIWGLHKSLVLSVDSKYGLADYPPVSISILKKKEKAQVQLVLLEIVKRNNVT